MGQAGYSIGRDVTITVVAPGGGVLDFGKITQFDSRQESNDHKVIGIDGITDNLRFFTGWSGSFACERRGPSLDAYFKQLEANFYAGIDEPPATILQTIVEPSGAVTQHRFERVLLKYSDAGTWKGDSSVPVKVDFMAAKRV